MTNTNTYAALSAAAYSSYGAIGSSSEWVRLQNYSNSSSGFQAALFENFVTGEKGSLIRRNKPYQFGRFIDG